jgi:hypothetical protein
LSFPDLTARGRRAIGLAALGASTIAAALAAGVAAHASPTWPRAHPMMRDMPPLAHTGGFGEPTCTACHFDGGLNDAAGSLAIDGLPARYEPGRRYRLTITVRHPDLRLAGFELASRFATGPDSGRQAGSLAPTDDRAQVSTDETSRIQYAHHLRSGTTPLPPGVGRWTVEWTAPTAGTGPVAIHVVGNAANDNDSPMGDYIYARSATIPTGEK